MTHGRRYVPMTYFDSLADARKKLRENSLLALEMQVEMAEFMDHPSSVVTFQRFAQEYATHRSVDPLQRGAWIHDNVKRIIGTAPTYYVTPDMCEMAKMAAEEMPSEGLSPTVIPSESGFLFFSKPIIIDGPPAVEGGEVTLPVPIMVIAWEAGSVKNIDGTIKAGVTYYLFSHPHDMAAYINQAKMERIKAKHGKDWPEPVDIFDEEGDFFEDEASMRKSDGPLAIYDFSGWVYGASWNSVSYSNPVGVKHLTDSGFGVGDEIDGVQQVHPIVDQVRRHMLATWLLLSQTVTTLQTETPPRFLRRRASRFMPENGDVIIIRLRKEITVGPKPPNEEDYEVSDEPWYNHRFLVRGHWKHQHYGKGNAEVKLIWVPPYIKGPEDAPLVLKDRIFSLEG